MAKYLEKAKEIRDRINELVADYPGLENDPRFAQIIYESIKAMPRVQGTV